MPAINGVIADGDDFAANANMSPDAFVVAGIYGPFDVVAKAPSSISAAYVRKANVAVPAKRVQLGTKADSYYSDYYNRIHVVPNNVNLGDMTSNDVRDVEVWNSYTSPKQLSQLQSSGAEGVGLIQPQQPPTTFAGFESRIYQLTVSLNGPPDIDAQYLFDFGAETPKLKVTGRRVILFPWPADFATGVIESLEWKTDVLRAYSGKEQRRSLRETARSTYEFSITVNQVEAQKWRNLMWGWQSRLFAVPLWHSYTELTSAASPGATVISCNTVGRYFAKGGTAVLYVDENLNEMIEVVDFTAGQITAKRPINSTWPAGTRVYPAVFAHLPDKNDFTQHTDQLLQTRCVFATSPDVTDDNTPAGAALVTYDGIEVLLDRPNWDGGIARSTGQSVDTVDFGIGRVQWTARELVPENTTAHQWQLVGLAEINSFRSMLGRMRGRLKPFWVPSWTDDFTVTMKINPTDMLIAVKDNVFARQVGLNPNRNRVLIRTNKGDFYRRIVGFATAPDGNAGISIDAALNTTIEVSEVIAIHLLQLHRFSTDKFEFRWLTNEVVTVDSNLTSIQQ